MGINQQKNAMIKQRLTSSVSIFLTSPYLTTKIIPRAAIPTTTIDHPTINHLKKSDKRSPFLQAKFRCHFPAIRSDPDIATLPDVGPCSYFLRTPSRDSPRRASIVVSQLSPHSPRARRLCFLMSAWKLGRSIPTSSAARVTFHW